MYPPAAIRYRATSLVRMCRMGHRRDRDFRHMCAAGATWHVRGMTQARLIAIAAAVALLLVGVPAFVRHAGSLPVDARWVAAFAALSIAFAAGLRHPRLWLLAVESAAALALVLLRCHGYEGTLLAVVAMQLGARLGRRAGMTWIVAQTALLTAAVASQLSPRAAFLLAPPYLGFQVVAFFTFELMAREVSGRAQLAVANGELRAMQEVLAETSRMAERLRIAHELHDALGHRLTTLTLNLEAALRQPQGPARSSVETAQSQARQLLADVREIVTETSARGGMELAQALQALVVALPRPRVHLEVSEGLRAVDPERAHLLLRCAQEIVTNAARHSAAENLWIVISREDDAFRMVAHDDGRGSDGSADGFGLRGMRERVERAGGNLRVSSSPGRGFDVTAVVPARSGTA